MSDLDRPLRDAVRQVHELSVKMRGLLDAVPTEFSSVTVSHADLERFIALTSFIADYRLAELEKNKAYELVGAGKAIRCRRCGITSWNLNDVEHRYCGACHVFHET